MRCMKTVTFRSEAATDNSKLAAEITDKRGYAARYSVATRTIDNFLGQGMPHLKIGNRRVRIVIAEADAWMRENFATRRLSRLKPNPEREASSSEAVRMRRPGPKPCKTTGLKTAQFS